MAMEHPLIFLKGTSVQLRLHIRITWEDLLKNDGVWAQPLPKESESLGVDPKHESFEKFSTQF